MATVGTVKSRPQRAQASFELCSFSTHARFQEFKCFSKLPLELRITIWNFALPGPRILDIFRVKDDCTQAWNHRFVRYKSFHTNPTLLAVCHESRKETLKTYVVIRAIHGFSLAFNPKIDTIHGYFGGAIDALDQHIFTRKPFTSLGGYGPRIQRMAIDESMLQSFREGNAQNAERLAIGWLSLKEIFIVLSPTASLQWPHCLNAEQTRILHFGVSIEKEEGWGNADLQNRFTMLLLKARQKLANGYCPARNYYLPVIPEAVDQIQLPTVRVVQWGMTSNQDEPFCVPLT